MKKQTFIEKIKKEKYKEQINLLLRIRESAILIWSFFQFFVLRPFSCLPHRSPLNYLYNYIAKRLFSYHFLRLFPQHTLTNLSS